jgi:hypothetical protein
MKILLFMLLCLSVNFGQSIDITTASPGMLGAGGSVYFEIGKQHILSIGAGGIIPFNSDKPEGTEIGYVSPNWILSGVGQNPKYTLYVKSGVLFYGSFYTGVVVDAQYTRRAVEYYAPQGGYRFYSVIDNKWIPYFGGEVGYKFSNILTTVNYTYARGIGLTVSIVNL